jgi:hypothetical protein
MGPLGRERRSRCDTIGRRRTMCLLSRPRRISYDAVRRLMARALAIARDVRDTVTFVVVSSFTDDASLE